MARRMTTLTDRNFTGGLVATRLVRRGPAWLVLGFAIALLLAGALSLFPAGPAHAQVDIRASVTIHAALPSGED